MQLNDETKAKEQNGPNPADLLVSSHLESGLHAAGDNHRYQFMMLLSFFFLKIVTDSFYAPLPFFLLEPKVVCLDPKTQTYNLTCNRQEICEAKRLNKTLDYTFTNNFGTSFISEFGVLCDAVKIGLIVSTASIGNLLSNVVGPVMTDGLGRKMTIMYILFFDIIVKSSLFFVVNIYWVFTITTLMNFTNNTVYNCASLYLNEMVGSKKRGFYALFFNSLYGISGILYTLLFFYYPTWQILHLFSVFSSVMSTLLIGCFMRESIRYYFMQNDKQAVLKELENIAKFNNREKKYNHWFEKNLIKKANEEGQNLIERQAEQNPPQIHQDQGVFSKIYSSAEATFNFISFSFISLVIITGLIFNAIDVKHTDDIFLNPIIFYFTDFVILLATGLVIDSDYVGRKRPSILFSMIATIFYFVKYSLMVNSGTSIFWIDYVIRFSVSISFNILMEWNWEIYPTDIRSTAFNINKLFSRVGDFAVPIIMEQNRPIATILVSSLYGVMCLFLFKIKETQGKSLQESTVSDEEKKQRAISEESPQSQSTANSN